MTDCGSERLSKLILIKKIMQEKTLAFTLKKSCDRLNLGSYEAVNPRKLRMVHSGKSYGIIEKLFIRKKIKVMRVKGKPSNCTMVVY